MPQGILPAIGWRNPNLTPVNHDREGAKALLEEAGWDFGMTITILLGDIDAGGIRLEDIAVRRESMSPTTTDTTAGGMRPEPFLDWQAVWPETSGYEPDGRAYTVGAPHGVRLAVQQAVKSERLVEFDRPWEERRPSYPCVLRHDGTYHLWYGVGTSEQYPHGALCYAHSEDGFAWHRPELDLYPFGDHRKTNIVYPHRLEGSVFYDANEGDFKLVTMEARWLYGDEEL